MILEKAFGKRLLKFHMTLCRNPELRQSRLATRDGAILDSNPKGPHTALQRATTRLQRFISGRRKTLLSEGRDKCIGCMKAAKSRLKRFGFSKGAFADINHRTGVRKPVWFQVKCTCGVIGGDREFLSCGERRRGNNAKQHREHKC